MVRRGRFDEREKVFSRIRSILENKPDVLGVRDLKKESGVGSYETFYKYLKELLETGEIEFHEVKVGRGKPKKILKLSQKGTAHLVEFKILENFEAVRESCMENERFEIDNFAFSYAIYGLPKNLNQDERSMVKSILTKIDSALWELDEVRAQVTNKEGTRYHAAVAKIYDKLSQYVSKKIDDKRPTFIDVDLRRELDSYIPHSIQDKMSLEEKDIALVITHGPSWIDDYSLRPENYLMKLIQAITNWDDAAIDSVIRHLAMNEHVDEETIERLKQWNVGEDKITQFDWQKIKDRLDDIPRIQEELKRKKERFIKSGGFKREFLGLGEEDILIVTKEMLGKRKLNEIEKELSSLNDG